MEGTLIAQDTLKVIGVAGMVAALYALCSRMCLASWAGAVACGLASRGSDAHDR